MALLNRLLPSASRRLTPCFLSKRFFSTPSSSSDLDKIMGMLGFGTQAPALDSAANYLTTRQAVAECLESARSPSKQQESDLKLQPLTEGQQEELNRRIKLWTEKYQQEWDMDNQLDALKDQRRQTVTGKTETEDDLQAATHQKELEQKRRDRKLILSVLPSLAEEYVRNNVNWEHEYVQLEEEVQRRLIKRKAQEFTKAYLERDPLKKYTEGGDQKPEPVIVQLSTLLEHIDPRFATKLRETGMTLEDRHVDMSQPSAVVQTLTDLGYSVNKDGDLNDVHHLTFPYDVNQRENLMRGLRSNGTPMSENEKWQKILETPEITSPALEHKRRQIDYYMRQQRQNNQIPPLPVNLNPELLPEELRPTIDDLDPDTKPLFVNNDVVEHDACPICKKPKTGPQSRKRCGLPKDTPANVTHTNVELLTEFVNELGMIIPKKKTGVCSKQQRQIARSIKRSRQMGLMPYTSRLKFGKSYDGRPFELYNLLRRHNLLDNRQSGSYSSQ